MPLAIKMQVSDPECSDVQGEIAQPPAQFYYRAQRNAGGMKITNKAVGGRNESLCLISVACLGFFTSSVYLSLLLPYGMKVEREDA